jgi:hypothetical protein
MTEREVAILDAFKHGRQVLLQGVSGITDLITTPGLINLDFADVKPIMSNAGSALMGIGYARGEDRARAAARWPCPARCSRPSIDGARGILLSIAGGSDLGLFEVNEAADLIHAAPTRTPTSSSAPSSTTPWATRCGSRSSPPASTLAEAAVPAEFVGGCTREEADLHSYRRDGSSSGRLVGAVWRGRP